jgi:lipid II:glycine glycyltransferase (peptidoglycan interpeptide bridge formation enzyme)
MDIKTISYEAVEKDAWDELVNDSPDGWLYQTSAWIDFAQNWGSTSLSFAVITSTGELLAVVPLYTDKEVAGSYWRNKRLYTGMSGPVLAGSLGNKARKKVWKFIFTYIDDLAQKNGADLLQVRLTTVAPSQLYPLRKEVNPLWNVGIFDPLNDVPSVTVLMDLTKSEEKLKQEMDEDCRAAIKQGERNGLTYRVGNSQADLELYEKIHKESWLRTGMIPHPLVYFTDMVKLFGDSKAVSFIFAEHEGQAVAGMLLHLYKNAVFYWGGCSLSTVLKLRPNNFLLWSAIKWTKSQGYEWFEVGQYQTYPGHNLKEYNVGRFKAQFSSNVVVPFEGQKNYTVKPGIIRTIRKIRDSIPQFKR